MIACILLPDFAAAIERFHHPELQEKSLILCDYSTQRGRVLAASEAAREAGIQPKMALSRARGLCPEAEFVSPHPHAYQDMIDQLFEVFWQFTDRVEHDATHFPQTGVFYLDIGQLTETETHWLGEQVKDRTVKATALIPSIGIAKTPFSAFVAAHLPHAKVSFVEPGRDADFLAPFPVTLLALSREMRRKLDIFKIRTLGELARLSRSEVLAQFGKPGLQAYQQASGLDSRRLTPQPLERLEVARRDFDGALNDLETIDQVLKELAGQLSRRLERSNQAASHLTLVLHFEDNTLHREELSLSQAVYGETRLFRVLQRPFKQIKLQKGIVSLEVQLAELTPFHAEQLDLFTFKPQKQRLKEAIANLIARYGEDCFYEVIEIDQDALLIERRFGFEPITPE